MGDQELKFLSIRTFIDDIFYYINAYIPSCDVNTAASFWT